MPYVVLQRSLTFLHRSVCNGTVYHFRRGDPIDVAEPDYNYLLARGGFRDPQQQLDFMHPREMFRVPSGAEVPVFRDSGMGDVMMVALALREAAGLYPHIRFTYCTNSRYVPALRDLVECRVIPAHELRGRYPYAVDLRGYSESAGREKRFRLDVFCNYLLNGRPPSSYQFPLYPRPEEAERGRARLGVDPGRPVLAIVYGCDLPYRNWPLDYQERLAELAAAAGWLPVWLHNGRVESLRMAAAGAVNLTGQTTVQQLLEVLQATRVLVAPDTGTVYLGEALGTRTVALYTTVPPEVRLQHFRWTSCMYAALPCAPCYHNKCELPEPKPCAVAIGPDAVWQQVRYMAETEPPWALRAEFRPVPVGLPASRIRPPGPRRPSFRPVAMGVA